MRSLSIDSGFRSSDKSFRSRPTGWIDCHRPSDSPTRRVTKSPTGRWSRALAVPDLAGRKPKRWFLQRRRCLSRRPTASAHTYDASSWCPIR